MNATESLPTLSGVDRRAKLSQGEFVREYLGPRRPVVITDALRGQRALGRWSPEFFRAEFGARQISVHGAPRALGPFIDEVLHSTAEQPAPYFRNELFREVFPELIGDLEPPPPYLAPNWLDRTFGPADAKLLTRCGATEIYIGGTGRSFPVLHYDWLHTHAFLMQYYGRKQYFVYGPEQTPCMYPFPDAPNQSQVNDVEQPDLERFPLFAQARGCAFTLDPGEMLFVPCGWWHTARMLSPSITVSVNIANSSNWADLTRDVCAHTRRMHPGRRKVLQLAAYLRAVGALRSLRELLHAA